MKRSLKENFTEFFARTTLHGLSNVMDKSSSGARRVFWLLLLIAVNGSFTFVLVLYFIDYLKYEYITTSKIERHDSQDLPAISVCPFTTYSRAKLENWTMFVPELQTLDPDINLTQVYLDRNFSIETIERELGRSYYESFFDLTYNIDEIFISCRLNLRLPPVNCSDYVTSYIGESSLCFTFHSAEFIREHGAVNKTHDGISDAVLLMFDVNPNDEWSIKSNAEGVWVQVHDPNDEAYMERKAVALTAGRSTFMEIKKVVYTVIHNSQFSSDIFMISLLVQVVNKRLPTPYTNGCEADENYSESKCLQECVLRSWSHCDDCTLYENNSDSCTVVEGIYCFYDQLLEIPNCRSCQPRCEQVTYEWTITEARFPNSYALQLAPFYGWPTDNKTFIQER